MQASSTSAGLPAAALAAQSLRQRGRLALRVTGTSMLPAVLPGDVVFVRRCGAGEPRPGELVLFRRGERLFVHRVVSRAGAALLTRGDANPQADAPVHAGELLGRVVRQLRAGRAFRPRPRPGGVARAAAALFRRSSRAACWFARAHALLAGRA